MMFLTLNPCKLIQALIFMVYSLLGPSLTFWSSLQLLTELRALEEYSGLYSSTLRPNRPIEMPTGSL